MTVVCTCTGITESEIREAIENDLIDDLYAEGMMQYCGSCREDIQEIFEELKSVTIYKC